MSPTRLLRSTARNCVDKQKPQHIHSLDEVAHRDLHRWLLSSYTVSLVYFCYSNFAIRKQYVENKRWIHPRY